MCSHYLNWNSWTNVCPGVCSGRKRMKLKALSFRISEGEEDEEEDASTLLTL